jgi:hypothetical protein
MGTIHLYDTTCKPYLLYWMDFCKAMSFGRHGIICIYGTELYTSRKGENMENQELSPRTQRIIEQLRERWQRPYQPSVDQIQRIVERVVNLQEPYQITGLRIIAAHILNCLYLHMLDLITVLQKNAHQEEISPEDVQEVLDEALPEIFSLFINLNEHIAISSFDDLAIFMNVTISLQMLSRADTAENALSWLYQLPKLYPRRLQQEGLLSDGYPWKQDAKAKIHLFPDYHHSDDNPMRRSV